MTPFVSGPPRFTGQWDERGARTGIPHVHEKQAASNPPAAAGFARDDPPAAKPEKQTHSAAGAAGRKLSPEAGQDIIAITAPPVDNRVLRRAMQLSLDRKSFIDILGEGQYDIGAVPQLPAERIWGTPQRAP